MSDPKDLVEQLRQSNRRWKSIALVACAALAFAFLFGWVAVIRERSQAEAARRQAMDAMAVRAAQAAQAVAPGR